MERLVVEVGLALRGRNEGPQFVFVDPRRNDDAAAIVGSARRLVALFRARGVSVNKVIISIPATENGVAAAKELAAQGICTNLILVASLMHAAICAEAGATTISIAVGALLRAHERKRKAVYRDFAMHPGMEIIQATLTYFKQHKIPTRVVGRDFRQVISTGIRVALLGAPGFDAVCLSKTQLEALRWQSETRPVGALLDRAPQASMRANQAQHPTAFLEHGAEFMRLMSAGARGMVAASVFPALGRMELQMNIIEKMVREEVAWQLALRTLPIEVLFELRSPLPPSRAAEMRRKHKSNQARTRVGSQKRKPLEDACERENEGGLIEGVEYF
ncbi:hypothetical protein B0H11DRAFT_1970284 [Mycena galericulata]|nr:hypothetical protein B0H11DRAFT_1970284 [Mycena galericulata]